MRKNKELHPDLIPYSCEDDKFGSGLHHPLIIDLYIIPGRHALINEWYKHAKEAVDKAFAARDWCTYIFRRARPTALTRLLVP
jgi:hypothetical protein